MTNITQLAKVIRSKNAGPFMTTVDMFFEDLNERPVMERWKKWILCIEYKNSKWVGV